MPQRKSRGWFYFVSCTFLLGFVLQFHDEFIPLKELLLKSILGGYLLGVILYSFSDVIGFAFKWIVNHRNFRYMVREKRKKPKLRLRLIPDMFNDR